MSQTDPFDPTAILQNVLVKYWRSPRSQVVDNPFNDARVRHVLGCSPDLFEREMRWALDKTRAGTTAQLNEVLERNARIAWHTAHASEEKSALLNEFEAFSARVTTDRRMASELSDVLEELFTNAVYNAPTVEGMHINADRSRAEPTRSERPIEIAFAADSTHLAIVVRDHYGSLSPERLVESLERCYRGATRQVQRGTGGAGLGLFMIVHNASRVIFNLNPSVCTEIIVLRQVAMRGREFSRTAPTVNMFVHGGSLPADQRRAVRWPASLVAHCRLPGQRSVSGVILNVSETGLFVGLDDATQVVSPDQDVEVTILRGVTPTSSRSQAGGSQVFWEHEPDADETLRGRVRWTGTDARTRRAGMGVQLASDQAAPEGDPSDDGSETR